jgi:hypothetical protein
MRKLLGITAVAAVAAIGALPTAADSNRGHHLFVRVTLSRQLQHPVSGRLVVLLSKGTDKKRLELARVPKDTWIAAREVQALVPGADVDIDTDAIAFPTGFSAAPPGDYQVQAFLDQDHSYAYSKAGPGDLFSEPRVLRGWHPDTSDAVPLSLDEELPPTPEPAPPPRVEPVTFQSPSLTAFWGRPITISAYVLLPPGYLARQATTYPTVYWTHGFGGTRALIERTAENYHTRLEAGDLQNMIWVMLDESFPTGTVEFADSVNNGPWGFALIHEFIPYLEKRYRMDAKPSGRFLTGHSSGGWATLWLQVAYPEIFGGTWSTSPDPSDFRSFTGLDIYAPNANAYHQPDGSPRMLVRID